MELLGITALYCGTLSLGDGFVRAAHGVLPVPAPATLKLLEGLRVRPGPEGAGELVTPTGAGLVRVLAKGPPPDEYVPLRSGFGAGTKDPVGRANALRIVLAEPWPGMGPGDREALLTIAADVDDMTGEQLAALADRLREAGALDVVLLPTLMKKGRPGTRIEALSAPAGAPAIEEALLRHSTSIGVRRGAVLRRALPRRTDRVQLLGHAVSLKVVALPGGGERAKPEFDDLVRVSAATGRSVAELAAAALDGWARRNADGCAG
jgi:uncharacterized protein (DUF111 family)